MVSDEEPTANCIDVPLQFVISLQLLSRHFYLSLVFTSLIMMCFNVDLFGFICQLLDSVRYRPYTKFWKFSAIISSNIFSDPYSFSSPSGILIIMNI